eukprot:220207_1
MSHAVCLLVLAAVAVYGGKMHLLNYSGNAFISNNVVYEESSSAYDIADKWTIYIDNRSIDDLLYNDVTLSFEWNRSNHLRITGDISKFNFKTYYKQQTISEKNENDYIDHSHSNLSDALLYDYCQYPVPSSFKFSVESQWIESSLSSATFTKIPGEGCTNSNDSFWNDPYSNICDSPYSYLVNLDQEIFVKFFECSSLNDDVIESYKWYHTPQQITMYAQKARSVKIMVHDVTNNHSYTVRSAPSNSYAITNLLLNRALSHPYSYIYGNETTYFANITQWDGDEKLLEAMRIDIDVQIFNATQDFNVNSTINWDEYMPYSFDKYLYYNQRNKSFNIDFVHNKCSVFGENHQIKIELYYDIGLSLISSGYVTGGHLDADSFIGNEFNLYSYGQHSNLEYYRYPEYQYFSLEELTPGEYYKITFEYSLYCTTDSDFSFKLYQISNDFIVANGSNETVYGEIYTLIWNLTDAAPDNSAVSVRFMATSDQQKYVFKIDGVASPTSSCYTEIEWTYLMETCLGNDVLCDLTYDVDSACSPFILVDIPKTWHNANTYCEEMYRTNLFCPTGDNSALIAYLSWLLESRGIQRMWFGATDEAVEGTWKCVNEDDGDFSSEGFTPVCANCWNDNYGGSEHCSELWYTTFYGLNDIWCGYEWSFLCKNEWETALDPDKLANSGAEVTDIGDLQECIEPLLKPFLSVTALGLEVDNEDQVSTNWTDSTCIESLAAIMDVEPVFEEEFGCKVEYVGDASQILPMYLVNYEMHFGNQTKFVFSEVIYMESIEDMILKTDTLSELGFDLKHKINGIDIDAMNEEMMLRFKRNDNESMNADYTFSIDSYQYLGGNSRPFYYTTDEWEDGSCDGTAVNGLSSLQFEAMCSDNRINIFIENETNYDNQTSANRLYQVPISSFMSQYTSTVDDWNVFEQNDLTTTTENGYLSVDAAGNRTDIGVAANYWLFEVKLPSYLIFESKRINQITFEFPIVFKDITNSFSMVFALTDSMSFVAVSLKCKFETKYNDTNHTRCYPLFYPGADSSSLGRMNPRYQSTPFINWSWNSKYNESWMAIDLGEECVIKLTVYNNPITRSSVALVLSVNGYSATYTRNDNTGFFRGGRDLYLQFGHYYESPVRYWMGSIQMERTQISTLDSASDDTHWSIQQLVTDCDECDIVFGDSGSIDIGYVNASLVLKWLYPIEDAYFLVNHVSSIKTVITMNTMDVNPVFVFTDGVQCILFVLGPSTGYAVYPAPNAHLMSNQVLSDNAIAYRNIIKNELIKVSDFNTNNSQNISQIIVECVNDPALDSFMLKLYHDEQIIDIPYDGSFESMSNLYLYFGSYQWSEVYHIHSLYYEKQLVPNIEFEVSISSEDNVLQQIATTYSAPSTLVTALFMNMISLTMGNGTNYWKLELSAAFDNCQGLEIESENPQQPGFAQLTIFEYNESVNYRQQLFDIAILQTECPATILIYIEHPTFYNPLLYINNCSHSAINNTNSSEYENCTTSTVHAIPFMIRWVDNAYSYIFKVHYFHGPYRPSSITYDTPYDVIDAEPIRFWLFDKPGLFAMCLLLAIFGVCCSCCACVDRDQKSIKCYLFRRTKVQCNDGNHESRCCMKCEYERRGDYMLDGSKIKREVLDNLIFHHFDEDACTHLLTQSVAKHKGKIIGRDLTPFELSLYIMPATFVIAISTVFGLTVLSDAHPFSDDFDDLFFNNAFTVFISFLTSIMLYIVMILCIYGWFTKKQKIDFFSGEILHHNSSTDDYGYHPASSSALSTSTSGGLPKLTDNMVKFGAVIRFFKQFNKTQTVNEEIEDRERELTIIRTKTMWEKESEWKEEFAKYEANKAFNLQKHCLFMVGDCCCRLLNTFIFTFSFWISFYVWYAHEEIVVLYDVPNAIYAMNNDTQFKVNIIEDWETTESDAMLNYYNLKVTQCNNKMSINTNTANALMQMIQQYHVDQMYPSITQLLLIQSELRLKLDHILNGAEQSEYAGEVDVIMDEIQLLSDEGISLMSGVMETAENELHSLCMAMGVITSACSGGQLDCGVIVSGACYGMVASALSEINDAVNAAIDNLEDIQSTAVTPEIDESSANTPSATNTSGQIESDTDYPETEDANYNTEEMESGDSGQLNTGEELTMLQRLDLTEYKQLPVFNVFFWISFFDSIIIYYQLIRILKRMKQLHGGVEEEHDSRKDIEQSTKYKICAVQTTNFVNKVLTYVAKILLIGLPLAFICYGVYIAYNTTLEFFEIDSVTKLGLYQLYTAPVVAMQYKANALLFNQQQIYNQQLLPAVTNAMLTNINSIKDSVHSFNAIQYDNVSAYNQQKCEIQWSIASYGDTFYCFEKYYESESMTESCQGCAQDIKAMCMASNSYLNKQFEGDEYEIFNGKMAEKRKYCQFDEYPDLIDWHLNDAADANYTQIYSNWDTSLTLQCPNGQIINSIHYIGSGDYKVNDVDDWYGVYEAFSYLYQLNGVNYLESYDECVSINSDLISIHSALSDQQIADILSFSGDHLNYEYWIGLNDIQNEKSYVWTDDSTRDYNNMIHSKFQNERKCRYSLKIAGKRFCFGAYHDGEETDAIVWTKDGWHDVNIDNLQPFLCRNPNVNFGGIESSSSFMHSIESIDCVEANRGPFSGCAEFTFSDLLFGDNNGPTTFWCEDAVTQAGYEGAGWFLNGFVFSDKSGNLSALIAIRCCYVPGTVHQENDYLNPQYPSNLDVYGERVISADDINNKIGIKAIQRGSDQSISGFVFDSIADYTAKGCTTGNSVDCMASRVGIVDYESFHSEKLDENTTANINLSKLICDEGCHPNISSECLGEYTEDMNTNNGFCNPFVTKFQCDNINFTVAAMDEYEQCEVYPVYTALFYDYDSALHLQMIQDQLSPYVDAFGDCMIALWHTFFIWFIMKAIVFPFYFAISEFIADICCRAVRKKHFAKIELVLKLNDDSLLKRKENIVEMMRKQKTSSHDYDVHVDECEYNDNDQDIDGDHLDSMINALADEFERKESVEDGDKYDMIRTVSTNL